MPRTAPTPRQADALRRQRAHGNDLRGWLQSIATAAEKARVKAREKAAKKKRGKKAPSRGVDRVPECLRVHRPAPTYLVEHGSQLHPVTGRWVKGLPHTNPDRIDRLARNGRLRKELR